jgi:hypothetical protein
MKKNSQPLKSWPATCEIGELFTQAISWSTTRTKCAFLARKRENFWYYGIALKKMGFERGLLIETVHIG